jgi:hypothetical protein
VSDNKHIIKANFGIIDASTIKCCESSTAQAGARGVRDVARIHYPSCTDLIKTSLQFSCNFVLINASEGSLCFQIFNVFISNKSECFCWFVFLKRVKAIYTLKHG